MKTSRRANRETPARDNPVESCKRIRFDNEVFTQTPWKGYFVSKHGNVVSFWDNKKRCLRRNCHRMVSWKAGPYYLLNLRTSDTTRNNVLVHKIVAETFLGKRPKGYQIGHINEITTDNRLCNLQYLTAKENHNKAHLGKPAWNRIPIKAKYKGKVYYFDYLGEFREYFNFPKWLLDRLIAYGQNRVVGKQNKRSRYKIKKFTKSQETIEITFY